ncbi:hypothetical protein [Piscinibacter gummiphilus]|uniref:Uncharacterized protein n=1 Tax=Piscinibacter gummiphilus TaxID=946333 RepID=A0ABZ0CP22_9BURK|nr:hypothetical protein [Piscinibacter gummiphilus]WOB06722.1 hypothetical protein RXV79_17535 [Piscinibacter gummiphilus]
MSADFNDPRLPAVDRLTLSRERLRGALLEIAPPPDAAGDHEPSVLLTALMAIPGVRLVVDSVRSWWSQHPLHMATMVAGNTARTAMGPIARNRPFALIAAAVAVGGLIYWIKPWRGLLKPALLAGLVPHLVARAMDHVPLEAWMSAASAFASERMRGAAPSGAEPAATTSPQAAAAAAATPAPTPPVPRSDTLH